MSETEEITFEFLSDDPMEDDEFSGKGHKRSARSLVNAIIKLSNDNRSIGLEGAWGSGKTTVVKIAEKELKSSAPKKFVFFSFDLWANQSVDFRRAFLEDFLNWSKPYRSQKSQESLEARVQGKTKTVETESERQFSIFGYILMSALFLLPFLVLWLSPFAANLHRSDTNAHESGSADTQLPWLFQIFHEYAHWAAVSLVIIVISGFIIKTVYLWCNKRSLRKALDSSFSLFSRKSEKDTVTQTIRDGDPTKYEFHQIFTEILSSVQSADRRVVLVFDNIDRLPASLIQEVWSSVRSISSRDSCRGKPSEAVVTAVVPYDREHVLSAFEDKKENGSDSSEKSAENSESDYVLEDVFRKTFSAIVTVAPPVTSDAQAFFEQCFEKALPGHFDTGQKYRLFQILDVFLTERGINPTPRQVKSFVNDVGMLWFQWQNDISIEAIAIFVLHRTKLEAEPKSLQNPDTIHTRFRHFAPTLTLDSELAALAYNVEPGIALEILLERDITAALRNPKNDRLQELSVSPGFKHQLDRILMQHCGEWAASSLKDFETMLVNYSQITLEPSVRELCNRHLTHAIPKMEKFELESWEEHKSLFQIVSCIPKEYLVNDLKAVAEWISKSLPESLTEDLGRAWIKFIGGFIQEVSKLHGGDTANLVASAITVPYSPEFYLGVALDCDEVDLKFSQFASKAKLNSADISTALMALGTDNPSHFPYVWRELHYILKGSEKAAVFTKLMEQVQTSLLDEKDDRPTYLNNLVLIAAESINDADIKTTIQAAIVDGTLPWHAFKLDEANDWVALANALWLAHLTLKAGAAPALASVSKQPFGDVGAAHKWFNECYAGAVPSDSLECLADLVIEYRQVNNWVSIFLKSPQHVLYKDVLIEILASENCPALNLNTLVDSYSTLKQHFRAESMAAMVERVGNAVSTKDIEQTELADIPPALVRDIAGLKIDSWTALLGRIDVYLKSIKSSDWEEALTNDNHNRQLLFARDAQLDGVIPPNHLRTPLADFVSEIITSKEVPAESLDGHVAFWSALSTSSRKGVSADVLERIADRPVAPEGLEAAMSAFPKLFAELPLEERPETAVSKLLMPLLADNPERALEFVKLKPSDWANCVEKVSLEMRSQLNDYFSGHDDTEEYQPKLDELRKLLKLRRSKKKSKPEELDEASEADVIE